MSKLESILSRLESDNDQIPLIKEAESEIVDMLNNFSIDFYNKSSFQLTPLLNSVREFRRVIYKLLILVRI